MKYTILSLLIIATGCGFDDVDEPADTRESKPALTWGAGTVAVEYRPVVSDGAMVHAQFLLATNLDRRAAFDALEIWSPDQELDEDACAVVATPSTNQDDDPTLRLLSVNEITVETDRGEYRLAERRLPDAISGISGVIYGNDEGFDQKEIFIPFDPGSSYVIQAEGSDELAGFEVELVAPEPVLFETIAGLAIDPDREMFVSETEDVALTWVPGDARSDVYLELNGDQTMTCRLANDGEFVIPSRLLNTVGSKIDATLRTIETRTITIDELGPTQFIIGTTDDVSITVE